MPIPSTLIVDDSEEDRYLLKRLIREANLTETIFEKNDGQSALDFLKEYDRNSKLNPGKFPPILIFLDINMPRMDGYRFLQEFEILREQDLLRSIVIMMFTSSESEADRKRALSYECVKGYIVKMPETGLDLTALLRPHFPDL